jgi:uncharacterized RDD family membrane protein YckC
LVPFAIDYIVGLTLGGQTLGMRLVSVRVARIDRPTSVGIVRAVVRTVLLMLFIPAVIVDKNNRGLHDRLTDTAVVPIRA